MHRGDCSFCTKLLRKDLFTIEQFPVGALNEDFHLLVKMLTREESAVPGIACIPGQAYHVFYRPDSNTRDKNRFSRVFADNIDNADMVLALVDPAAGLSAAHPYRPDDRGQRILPQGGA